MSAPIGPGDWVECVDDRASDFGSFGKGEVVVAGGVYLVSEVLMAFAPNGTRRPSLRLAGVVAPPSRRFRLCALDATRFRPIYRPDESLTRRLMEPLPDAVAPSSEPVSEPQPRDPEVVRAWSWEDQ